MIDLDSESLDFIKSVLQKNFPGIQIRAFGSRINGTAEKFSDLDLVIMSELPQEQDKLFRVKSEFSESDLPIIIDLLDWAAISESFRDIIQRNSVILC